LKNIASKATFDSAATDPVGTIGRYESTTPSGDFLFESQVRYVVDVLGTPTWVFLRGSYGSKAAPSGATLAAPLGIEHSYFKYDSAGTELEERYVPDGDLSAWVQVPVSSGGNANAPTATSPQNFFVNEDVAIGTTVGTVTATPAAAGPIVYVIADADDFVIDSATGVITTTTELNYSANPSYALAAYAVEGEAARPITVNISVNEVQEDMSNNVKTSDPGWNSFGQPTALLAGVNIGDTVIFRTEPSGPGVATYPMPSATGTFYEKYIYDIEDNGSGGKYRRFREGVVYRSSAPGLTDTPMGGEMTWYHVKTADTNSDTDVYKAVMQRQTANSTIVWKWRQTGTTT
jgi:hypothetical protein